MRIAIAGTGRIAERAHIPALRQMPGVEVVALQSRTREKPQELVERLWADQPQRDRPHVYQSFDEMLERERPDAVGVFAPNYLHCELTLKALAAGAHVLVEKPIAPTVNEARQMVDAAGKAGRVLMVAMQRRHSPPEIAIKECLDSVVIGKPHFIRLRLSHGGPESWAPGQRWFFDPAQAGGGAMLDLGVHLADLARWFVGEVDHVSGDIGTLSKPIDVEDNGVALLRFRSGTLGVLEASWTTRPALSALEIYASEGRILMSYPPLNISINRADGSVPGGYAREELLARFDPRDALVAGRNLTSNFVAAAENRGIPSPDGKDGLRAVEIIEACYRSARSGARIFLPLE